MSALDELAAIAIELGPDAVEELYARLDPLSQEALTQALDPVRLSAVAGHPLDPLASKPVEWVTTKLGEHLTEGQQAVARSIVGNRYTAVPASHDVGKSFDAARLALWWIDTHPPGEALVVTTAPTYAQVRTILWQEIGVGHSKGQLAGRITEGAEWKLQVGRGPSRVVGLGRKPADYSPAAFSGLHRRYVLVIIDEAGGVPRSIYDAIDTLVTNEEARVLAIGNPDDPSSHFAEVCKPGSGWNVVHLDGLRSPNFTRDAVAKYPALRSYMIREGIPPNDEPTPETVRPLLLSPQWVAERIARWGVDSPMFQSKVRGRFPRVAKDTLIDPHWVTLAQVRELPPQPTIARFGVDVARFGEDKSIVLLRLGGWCRVIHEIAKGPTTELSGWIIRDGVARSTPPVAMVDDVGIGGGVTDELRDAGYPVMPMLANARATRMMKDGKLPMFVDARSEWWWYCREALQGPSGDGSDGWLDLDPDDDELAHQLTVIRYRLNRRGQIQVETKDEMKGRGLASPDRGDALVMALQDLPMEWVPASTSELDELVDPNAW